MTRLIDADVLIENIVETAKDLRTLSTKTIGEAIHKTPIIDAVPVIRCKDCYWYGADVLKQDGTIDKRYKPTWCYLLREETKPTDYCSMAERRYDADKREDSQDEKE